MNVREMYNYGYKWTGMIPLTAEEARNLFLNDSILPCLVKSKNNLNHNKKGCQLAVFFSYKNSF